MALRERHETRGKNMAGAEKDGLFVVNLTERDDRIFAFPSPSSASLFQHFWYFWCVPSLSYLPLTNTEFQVPFVLFLCLSSSCVFLVFVRSKKLTGVRFGLGLVCLLVVSVDWSWSWFRSWSSSRPCLRSWSVLGPGPGHGRGLVLGLLVLILFLLWSWSWSWGEKKRKRVRKNEATKRGQTRKKDR